MDKVIDFPGDLCYTIRILGFWLQSVKAHSFDRHPNVLPRKLEECSARNIRSQRRWIMSKKTRKRAVRKGHLRETMTDWYISLMLLVYCLWCPEGFTNLEEPKFIFFTGVTLLWFVLLVSCSFAEELPTGFFTPARISALVFAAVCLLSAIFSPFDFSEVIVGHRYTGLLTQLLLAIILLGVSRFGHCKERHFIAFGISITILGVISIIQKFGINIFDLYPGDSTYYDYYSFLGTIGNVDTLAAPLSLAIPLFLGLFVKSEVPYYKLYLIPLFFSAMTLILGGAESGLLGVAVVSVITPAFLIRSMKDLRRTLGGAALALAGAALGSTMGIGVTGSMLTLHFVFGFLTVACLGLAAVFGAASWLLRFVRREPSERLFRNAFIVLAVVCVVGALTAVWFWPGESGTLYEASQILHGNFDDNYGGERIGIWRTTLTNVPEAPILGGGPGTLHLRTVRVLTNGTVARLAHNTYLQYLVDTGILGLLSYLAVIVTSIFVRRRDQWKQICIGLILAAMSYAVQDFFNLGVPVASPFFWIVLGLLQTDTHEKPVALNTDSKKKAISGSRS